MKVITGIISEKKDLMMQYGIESKIKKATKDGKDEEFKHNL